jgi:hypothetical protein
LELPAKFTISVPEDPKITSDEKRAREWCGSIVGAMVWLSSIIPAATYTFRGQPNTEWNLESSLFRAKKPNNLRKLKQEEDKILEEISRDFWFRKEFGFVSASDSTRSGYERTVAVLQHHGIPTRLLDVTADPLVALYFAVIGGNVVSDMDNVDGAVIFIRNLTTEDELPIMTIMAPQVSERVSAQRARFIAPTGGASGPNVPGSVRFDFAYVDVANKSGTNFNNLVGKFLDGEFSGRPPEKAPNLLMFRIPGKLKPACRQVLRSIGVSARTLFPGGQGYSRDLAGF